MSEPLLSVKDYNAKLVGAVSKDTRSLSEILLSIQVELATTELETCKKLQALRLREQKARTEMAEEDAKYQSKFLENYEDELALPKIGIG